LALHPTTERAQLPRAPARPGSSRLVPAMGSCARLLLLWGCSAVAAGLSGVVGVSSRCEKACNPRMGNLALGRKLWADTTCGQNATDLYCSYSENADLTCRQPKCDKCHAAQPHLAHLPAAMADSSFRFPRTWWQSAEDVHREKIQLDLEAEFYFTHLIMVFKSPRPAAMCWTGPRTLGRHGSLTSTLQLTAQLRLAWKMMSSRRELFALRDTPILFHAPEERLFSELCHRHTMPRTLTVPKCRSS